jgi:perosamine synthetase
VVNANQVQRRLQNQPALLGGCPVRKEPFPPWPQIDNKQEQAVLAALRSGKWDRHSGDLVLKFERAFASLCGVKHALMVSSGSTALEIAMRMAGVEAGDEVLVPPYTFMATVMSVFLANALPVFVDIHPDTYCMEPSKIESRITPRTKAILPVHLAGLPCDMDSIKAIAARHHLIVIEDACQAHLAEWKGQRVGSIGEAGCFSFQISKNISGAEGGAITSNDSDFMDRCFQYHTCGRTRGGMWYRHDSPGFNYRMTEFQAALLLARIDRVEEHMTRRSENADYLNRVLSDIPGIRPLHTPDYVTRHAYHLYVFRYDEEAFRGLDRDLFVKALEAEGVPCSGGYNPLYREGFVREMLESRLFQQLFVNDVLEGYLQNIICPVTEKACVKEGVWIPQEVLLGSRRDMSDIVESIRKIQRHAESIKQIHTKREV